jgi:predicted kinase
VTGPPAAGKTTLASELGSRLVVPVLSKDLIKEALIGSLGVQTLAESQRLGRAAYTVLFAVASELLGSGISLLLEVPLIRGVSDSDVQRLTDLATSALIVCIAPPEVIVERYRIRANSHTRHSGHMDQARSQMLRMPPFKEPEVDVPRLHVDTSEGYRPSLPEIVDWLRHAWAFRRAR